MDMVDEGYRQGVFLSSEAQMITKYFDIWGKGCEKYYDAPETYGCVGWRRDA